MPLKAKRRSRAYLEMKVSWPLQTYRNCAEYWKAIYDDPPIVYEDIRFQREGFHDGRHNDLTSYEGYPNEENNAVWDLLLEGKYFAAIPQCQYIGFQWIDVSNLSVGVVGISKQENSRLLNGTATARKDQKQYVVELELFHQLHCLVRTRSYSLLSHPVCQLTLVRNGFVMYFGSWPRGQTPAVLLGPINGKTIPVSYVECLNQRALKAKISC